MTEVRKIEPFLAFILILSIIALVMLAIGPFAGFYYSGYGYRYSCLGCEYSTPVDLTAQIFILILLIIQIVITLNELVPNRFIKFDLIKYELYFAILTCIFSIVGVISFGVSYAAFDWWVEIGFYGPLIGGILNALLFYLHKRNI